MGVEDFRVKTGWFSHPKRRKLIRRLDYAGESALFALWGHTADNKPDGILNGYTSEDIADAAQWDGEPERLTDVLCELHLIDKTENGFEVHDWGEHNGWAATSKQRSDKARRAAEKKWGDAKKQNEQCPNQKGQKNKNAPYPSPSPSPLPDPSPSPLPKQGGVVTPPREDEVAPPPPEIPDPDQPPPPEKPSHLSRPKSLLEEMEEWWAAIRGRIPPLSPVDLDAIRQALSTGLPAADIRSLVEKKIAYLRTKNREITSFGYFKDQIEQEAHHRNLIAAPVPQHPLAQVPSAKKKPRLDDLDRYWAQVETGCWDPENYENGHELQEQHGLDPERREAS